MKNKHSIAGAKIGNALIIPETSMRAAEANLAVMQKSIKNNAICISSGVLQELLIPKSCYPLSGSHETLTRVKCFRLRQNLQYLQSF